MVSASGLTSEPLQGGVLRVSSRRHWWVRVELGAEFDHVHDFDVVENLAGYLSELTTYQRDGVWFVELLLSMPRRSRDEAINDALLLVRASCSAPVLSTEVARLSSWQVSRRRAATSLKMPGSFGAPPDQLTRGDRDDREDGRRLQTLVSRYRA